MDSPTEAEEISKRIYNAYGSDSGYLFGIPPNLNGSVWTIIRIAIEMHEEMKKE